MRLADFRYDVGNAVQLAQYTPAYQVVWRGRQRVNWFGQWHLVPVYRLDNGFWDCYFEDELHSAWRW